MIGVEVGLGDGEGVGGGDGLGDGLGVGEGQVARMDAGTFFNRLASAMKDNPPYAEDGPADGPVVLLLHGWPYDIHSYVDVAPMLAAEGYRVIVPYLRGFGSTRFLSDTTFRNGQQAALALDVIALMDALKIPKAIIGGSSTQAR